MQLSSNKGKTDSVFASALVIVLEGSSQANKRLSVLLNTFSGDFLIEPQRKSTAVVCFPASSWLFFGDLKT